MVFLRGRPYIFEAIMLPDTERTIHVGINFLVAPVAMPIDTQHELDFRRLLADSQLEFERTERLGQFMKFISQRTEQLEVQVGQAGPQVGQLLILSPQPTQPYEVFLQQAEAICHAFQNTWRNPLQPQWQIINRDACVRYLYQAADNHAFRYLWETRLRQEANDMRLLDRPVLGGGLRLVMPPSEGHRTQIEVKIESFLRDSRSLFVELQFAWPYPDQEFTPRQMLEEVRDYSRDHLVPFILGSARNQESG